MKKKIFLAIAIVAVFACLFSITAFAAGSESDAFGTAETISEGIPVDLTDTTSRVVLKGTDGLYRTFPSSYIYFKTGSGNWNWRGEPKLDFSYLNTALGLTDENAYTIDSIIRIEIPDDILYVEGFNGKVNLKEVYFSQNSKANNVRTIGNGTGLEKITLPPLVTSLPSYMFHTATSLKEVVFYDNCQLTSFPTEMFKSCTALEHVDVPDSVTTIGGSCFISCSNLKSVTMSSVTKINSNAFNGCTSLSRINSDVDGLVILPEGLTRIEDNYAFNNCDSIEYIDFPSTITFIGQWTFNKCDNLKLVSFEKSSAKILQAIENGETYTEVKFNNNGAFQDCTSLMAISIPAGATYVQNRFASGCTSLIAVYMPNTVTHIDNNGGGQGAFSNCKNMYFVQQPFTVSQCWADGTIDLTKLNLPEKPDVYYMPTELQYFGGHIYTSGNSDVFSGCANINNTIIFGEKFTKLQQNKPFNSIGSSGNVKTLVFLGDMQEFAFGQCNQYINYVFANTNDKIPTDLGILNIANDNTNTNSYLYFCASGLKYTYSDISKSMDQNAYNNAYNAIYQTEYDKAYAEVYEEKYQAAYDSLYQTTYDSTYTTAYDAAIAEGSDEETAKATADTAAKEAALATVKAQAETDAKKSAETTAKAIATAAGNEAKAAAMVAAVENATLTAAKETMHIHNPELDAIQDATCELPAGEFTFCFCGTLMTSDIVDGSVALGHLESETFILYYPLLNDLPNYFANVIESHNCEREGCGATIEKSRENSALFIAKGMTVPDYGISALCHAIQINLDAVEEYNAFLGEGNEIKYGVLAGVVVDGNKPVGTDGKSNCDAIVMGFEATKFSIVQLKLTGLEKANKQLYCGAYVVVDGVVSYLYEGVVSDEATPLVVNNGILDQTTPETTVEETKEN